MGNRAEVVMITGSSAGVGRAVAAEFGKHGATVGLIARGRAGLEGAKNDVEAGGGKAMTFAVDVSDAAAVEAAAAAFEEACGPIDVWVNVAFSNVLAEFDSLLPEDYKRITEVSYLGFVYGTMAALKRMKTRNRGTIVQIGSALAYRSIPLQAAYCGAKSAIRGFTDSIRCELVHAKSKVHITMVQLPAVNTPQFTWCKQELPHKAQPVPPIYQPEVIARGVYWAAHRRRREVWIGAPTVEAILGQRVIPGLLDRYLGKTGFAAQQYNGPMPSTQRFNLYEPVDDDRDYGPHGDFDTRALNFSRQAWLDRHRLSTALVIAAIGASVYTVMRRS